RQPLMSPQKSHRCEEKRVPHSRPYGPVTLSGYGQVKQEVNATIHAERHARALASGARAFVLGTRAGCASRTGNGTVCPPRQIKTRLLARSHSTRPRRGKGGYFVADGPVPPAQDDAGSTAPLSLLRRITKGGNTWK